MTSRVFNYSQYQTIGSKILAGLDKKEYVELLLKVARILLASWPSHESDAEIVVDDLSSHTLAIIQAGTYVARGYCLIDQYPDKLRNERDKLLQLGPKQGKSRYSDVYTTFEASASVLEKSKSIEANNVLHLLKVLSMPNYSELHQHVFETAWKSSQEVCMIKVDTNGKINTLIDWLVSQLLGFVSAEIDEWDDFRLQEASIPMASLSLITRRKQENHKEEMSMHSLVHAWARNRLASKEKKGQAWKTTGSILALSLVELKIWRKYYGRQLRPHVHSYLNLYISKRDLPDQISKLALMFLECAAFLTTILDNMMLANLLKRIFADLRIDPRSPSMQSYLLPLYDLQGRNLQDMDKIWGKQNMRCSCKNRLSRWKRSLLAKIIPVNWHHSMRLPVLIRQMVRSNRRCSC